MKTITRKEYQEYLKEQRQGTISDLLSQEIREFIKANESDITRAFIGTNISVISFLSPEEEHKQQILQGARQEMAETLQKLLNEGFDEPDLQKLLDNLAADIPLL